METEPKIQMAMKMTTKSTSISQSGSLPLVHVEEAGPGTENRSDLF